MAVTVTYSWPVIGAAPGVIPTAAQVADCVVFTLGTAGAGDDAATVVHNMGLSVADLAAGWPIVIIEWLTAAARTSLWIVPEAGRLTNSIAFAAPGGAAGVGLLQARVHVLRPHSIGQ